MIEAGDELMSVNGLDVSKMPFDAVVQELQAITVDQNESGAAADGAYEQKHTTLRFARNGRMRRQQQAVRRACGEESDFKHGPDHLVDAGTSSSGSAYCSCRRHSYRRHHSCRCHHGCCCHSPPRAWVLAAAARLASWLPLPGVPCGCVRSSTGLVSSIPISPSG